jgi:hypothetical protein
MVRIDTRKKENIVVVGGCDVHHSFMLEWSRVGVWILVVVEERRMNLSSSSMTLFREK